MAEPSRLPDVPLPADAVVSTVSIPAAVTNAVVRPREAQIRRPGLTKGQIAPDFQLKDIDGRVVKLSDFRGKVVVVNFWAMWCSHCVHELPDYQKLFDQYKNDPDVVILTIDNDQNPNDVPPWMQQKKFSFPVLYDDGFVAKAGITAFPTTWFLDRNGNLAFTKVGWSEKLIEEFVWRIEAIRK